MWVAKAFYHTWVVACDVAFCVPVVHSLCTEECGNIARTQAQNVHFLLFQFYTKLTVTHSRSHPWAGMNRQVAIYSVAAGVGAVGLSVGLCLLGRKLVEWFRVRLLARGSKQFLTFEYIMNHGRSLLEHCQLTVSDLALLSQLNPWKVCRPIVPMHINHVRCWIGNYLAPVQVMPLNSIYQLSMLINSPPHHKTFV